ncbi:transferase [Polaribacter sp. IC066]|uniref:DapH/DapD/GlmU-related protein n=1 Tax=Polaribacter sp. IC066 TaxID=57032 RepID=UPI0011BFDE50|nr:DapH/DapD/GlmU-related protein [Polaribacter sp. IC066]TXD56689.1 transferase [Polaribacter sp. IC066]
MNLKHNNFATFAMNIFRGYNHEKYWRRREIVAAPNNSFNFLLKGYYLWYIKRAVAKKNNCGFDPNFNSGVYFETPPILPHELNGIIIGLDLTFGKNLIINHQFTILHRGGSIGNNVLFGAGSKVLSGFNVGSDSKIGMNAVVTKNIPCNAAVVLHKSRIIKKCI